MSVVYFGIILLLITFYLNLLHGFIMPYHDGEFESASGRKILAQQRTYATTFLSGQKQMQNLPRLQTHDVCTAVLTNGPLGDHGMNLGYYQAPIIFCH